MQSTFAKIKVDDIHAEGHLTDHQISAAFHHFFGALQMQFDRPSKRAKQVGDAFQRAIDFARKSPSI